MSAWCDSANTEHATRIQGKRQKIALSPNVCFQESHSSWAQAQGHRYLQERDRPCQAYKTQEQEGGGEIQRMARKLVPESSIPPGDNSPPNIEHKWAADMSESSSPEFVGETVGSEKFDLADYIKSSQPTGLSSSSGSAGAASSGQGHGLPRHVCVCLSVRLRVCVCLSICLCCCLCRSFCFFR